MKKPRNWRTKFEQNLVARASNEWYDYKKLAHVYIRTGDRMLRVGNVLTRQKAITIANITVWRQRQGTFTSLIKELSEYQLPIVLENVIDKRWEQALVTRHGWVLNTHRDEFPNDLMLWPERKINEDV